MISRRQLLQTAGLAGVFVASRLGFAQPGLAAVPQRGGRRRPPARGRVRPHARPGYKVNVLPKGHTRIVVKGSTFYYHSGVFYRRSGAVYIVVRAPIGARVRHLPGGYVRFVIGARRYFFVNDNYFVWNDRSREYIVVEKPEGASDVLAEAQGSVGSEVYAYPRENQSNEVVRQDRYECHVWAVDETGFDPSLPNQDMARRGDYDRALAACLEGRGYSVK